MALFSGAAARLNAAGLRVMGDPMTVRVGDSEHTLTGILSSSPDQQSTMLPMQATQYSVSFDTAEFEATGAGTGAAVIHGGHTYRIIDTYGDDGGMTHVVLSPRGVQ